MTDIEKAKQSLAGHTIALCKGGDIVTSDKRGIAPMLGFIAENRNLAGYPSPILSSEKRRRRCS